MKSSRFYKYALSVMFVLAITSIPAIAQGRFSNVYSKSQVKGYIDRLENSSNRFRRDFDRAMDKSSLDGTDAEDRANALVKDYENALDRLRRQFNQQSNWWESRNNVQDMLSRAQPVNAMINNLPFGRNLESQWRTMRNDINKVADTYDLPGLNGGGWNGGGGNGGGWNGGGQISPPNWATGTFYGTDQLGRRVTLTISNNGSVSANTDGTFFTGSFTRGNFLSFADGTSRVTRDGNGFWTTRTSNGERTYFSRNGSGGGGGIGGGEKIHPPNWAVGTFYGTDSAGRQITLTIYASGDVAASTNGTPFSGSYIRGDFLSFADGASKVTRDGSGIWTTRSSNGERTRFRR